MSERRSLVRLPRRPAEHAARRKTVLIVSHEHSAGDASLRYRAFHQAESLALLGVSCDAVRYGTPGLLDSIAGYEYLVLHRMPWEAAAPFVERAHALGRPVFSDTDDLVFDEDIARHVEAIADMSDDWRREWTESYRRTIAACEGGAIASTEPLRERLQSTSTTVVVLPNVVNDEMVERSERAFRLESAARAAEGSRHGVVLSYFSGSLTHRGDFATAADAVLWALATYPDVRFEIVGKLELDDRFARFASRISHVPWHPWQTLPDLHARTDINLAPLADNPFSECKSAIKFLEAALVRVPTIASAQAEFVRAVEDGGNGLLAHDPESWRSAIERLIEDSELRTVLGRRAHEDVLTRHTTRARTPEVAEGWRTLAGPRDDSPTLTVDLLVGPFVDDGTLHLVVELGRSLAELGHEVRLCAEPGTRPRIEHLARPDLGTATVVVAPFPELAPADARIATDALTAAMLSHHENALFRFRLVRHADEVGFDLPVRHVCFDGAAADVIAQRGGRAALRLDGQRNAGRALADALAAACFARLS